MKVSKLYLLLAFFSFFRVDWALAQAPATIAGDAVSSIISDGSSPFASSGYAILIPANAGNSYELLNPGYVLITNSQGTVTGTNIYPISTGTYSYSGAGTGGTIEFVDSLLGDFDGNFTFTDDSSGDYSFTGESNGDQDGTFQLYTGPAPASIAGLNIVFNVSDGLPPFPSSGTYTFTVAGSGNTYTITGDSPGLGNTSGTYTYAVLNNSVGSIAVNDVHTGVSTCYLMFADTNDGGFGVEQRTTGGFEAGDFSVVTAPLTVQMTGQGTVSPNYSNAVLQVGASYNMTAVAGPGFAFTNWTGGTGLPLTLVTNKATVHFSMTPNLVLQANFVDTNKPALAITNVTDGMLVENSGFTVEGTASSLVGLTNVLYSLDNGAWTPATTANNWSNWTAGVTLLAGTNTVGAYAVDDAGNVSATDTVTIVYGVTAPLTVQTTGVGTVSPDYSNALLQVGADFSMKAAAAAGYTFTNWTGGTSLPLTFLTNGPTVQFFMTPNLVLQANFADTNIPVLAITNVTKGMQVNNSAFTVAGTATGAVAVANVLYSPNNGAWTLATTANHWSNWTAGVTLVPGTNTIGAYAVDNGGNHSLTNNVSLFLVVTNQLQIRTTGLGTISPNYSNAWLQIGMNYSITSSPAAGFGFTNWIISTNWLGGTAMTKTNLSFMMTPDLTLQANFLDLLKPTNTITAPTAGQHMTNALANLVGTARDNWGVSGVWFQLNQGAWNTPTTTNGWTNWTTTVELISGTNTVAAYAMDLGGNVSTTNSISVVSSNTFKLELAFTNTEPLVTNGLAFSLELSSGLNGHIQVSSNLISWATLTNFVGTNSILNFLDPAATNSRYRYYRATIP